MTTDGLLVDAFTGWAIGSYSSFNEQQDVYLSTAFVALVRPGVQLNHLPTCRLDGDGGIDSVVDGVGAPAP